VGGNANEPQFTPKYQGDLVFQNVRRNIGWLGSFAMAEYKGGWYTAFLNVSASYSGYQQTNFFLKKTIELSDTTLNIGYNDTTTYGGVFYDRNHPDLKHNTTPIKYLLGYVVKGGMNFNVTESQNVFFNVGYFSRAPQMQFVFNNANVEWKGIKNEEIRSAEIGYNFKSPFFSYNFNSYYTIWNNRPTTVSVTTNSGESVPAFATGMSAVHKGVEMDFIIKPFSNFSFEGMVSLGDWKWATPATAIIFDNDGNEIGQSKFDPSGVRVGDAAQFTYGASLRYEPFKMFYIKPQFNYFSRNYANFSPEALQIDNIENNFGPNVGRQSWRMPDYGLLDLNLGYGFFNNNKKYDIRFSCINILDTFFISDANDNALLGQSFSAATASVNVGMGRRWVFSVTATF
jgi:iron complex outermembrane receptor protein